VKSEARSFSEVSRVDSSAARGMRTLIVGVTGDGYVPVVEEPITDAAGDVIFGVGRSLIGLPSVVLDSGPTRKDPRTQAAEQLNRDFGYDVDELIPMDVSRPPGILLAPMLRIAEWRERVGFVPGVYEVPLRRLSEWMWQRRMLGAIESPGLRRGLALAQARFPRWARARLSRAIGEIEARAQSRA
jgi:hypothetical protein